MLEPMTHREAVSEYLDEVQQELAVATAQNHKYRLDKFLIWSDEARLTNMNEITGSLLQEFEQWLMGDVAKVTVKNHLSTVRQFVEFCEDINVAPNGVGRKIRLPTMQPGEDVRDVHILQEEAEVILATVRTTGMPHSVTRPSTLWHTGMRASALTGYDINGYDDRANVLSLRPLRGEYLDRI